MYFFDGTPTKDDFSEGGLPFICGGYNSADGYSDLCYKYEPANDEWYIIGVMDEERSYSGYGSSESWGLVMAGGRMAGGSYLSSVATTDSGDLFGYLPELPDQNRLSCLVPIDDERIFTCGGDLRPEDTLIFSNKTRSWTRCISNL